MKPKTRNMYLDKKYCKLTEMPVSFLVFFFVGVGCSSAKEGRKEEVAAYTYPKTTNTLTSLDLVSEVELYVLTLTGLVYFDNPKCKYCFSLITPKGPHHAIISKTKVSFKTIKIELLPLLSDKT